MFNRYVQDFHNRLHFLGLMTLCVAIPLSKGLMSVSMMVLFVNILLEGNYKSILENYRGNRLLYLILAFFGLHLLGLLWTGDQAAGWHDIRVKLPFLFIPLVIFAKPLRERQFQLLLSLFIATLAISTLINFVAYQFWFGPSAYDDIRGMSLFGSHIRFGLMVSLAAAFSLHRIKRTDLFSLLYLLLVLWFCYYTYYSQVLSGMITLFGVFFVYFVSTLYRINKWIAVFFSVGTLTFFVVVLLNLLTPMATTEINIEQLPKESAEGNPYIHNPTQISPETGDPVELYICPIELEREWNKVSEIPYDTLDAKGNTIRWNLIRYMSSKGLKKDAEGFSQLDSKDIRLIEQGHASRYHRGFLARYYDIKYQINNPTDPNHHSLLMRLEFWKGGVHIARENLLIGVGTGDASVNFKSYYKESNSALLPENQCEAHSNYLTVLLTFGIFGLFLFFWMHTELLVEGVKQSSLYIAFFLAIMLLSYLIEDTLETQSGITFFAYFYSLFANRIKGW